VYLEDKSEPTLDAACRVDLSCSKEYAKLSGAEEVCTKAVESLARYDFEWTERWFNRFPGARLLNERRILIGGEAIRFQNGFGAFGKYKYTCEWDLDSKILIEVKAELL
jgi:hypothetical protein